MKKIFTAFGVIASALLLILSVSTVDAKTSSKKKSRPSSSSSTSIDGASFLEYSTFMNDEGFYSSSIIGEDLQDYHDFKLKSTSKERISYGENYVTAKKSVYNGGNVTVSIWAYHGDTILVEIKFTRTSDLNSFIDRTIARGWMYSNNFRNARCYYWEAASMYVEGLNVTLSVGG